MLTAIVLCLVWWIVAAVIGKIGMLACAALIADNRRMAKKPGCALVCGCIVSLVLCLSSVLAFVAALVLIVWKSVLCINNYC